MSKRTMIMFGFTSVLLIIVFTLVCYLTINKTFLKTTYVGVSGQEIFIPKYSYFKDECCFTAATFYSLRKKEKLQSEIDAYLKDFEYFEDESTYGYKKDELLIQKYEVEDKGLYRKIIITY